MNIEDIRTTLIYAGSYTNHVEAGLHVYSFHPQTLSVTLIESYHDLAHPSYVKVDWTNHKLYAVSETMEYLGQPGGSVASYIIDPKTGTLSRLNQKPTVGGAPCHVSLDQTGQLLFVANYMGGSVCLFSIEKDGSIGSDMQLVEHHMQEVPSASYRLDGKNPERQEAPHVHFIDVDPTNQYAIAVDLGLDQLIAYEIDVENRRLRPRYAYATSPGAGPRHFVFHPNGQFIYLINELNSTVSVLSYQSDPISFAEIQTVSTLPPTLLAEFKSENTGADIHVSEDGKFLYASNRGHDSIAVYGIDPENGTLALVEHTHTEGKTPRNFAMSPCGNFVLVANQNSDQIVIFKRNSDTGRLQNTGVTIQVSMPVCIQMVQLHN